MYLVYFIGLLTLIVAFGESHVEFLGCFTSRPNDPEHVNLLLTDRDRMSPHFSGMFIDWGNWDEYSCKLIERCAKAAEENGCTRFGLEYYGECWCADGQYSKYGGTSNYIMNKNGSCKIGKGFAMCVYQGKTSSTISSSSTTHLTTITCGFTSSSSASTSSPSTTTSSRPSTITLKWTSSTSSKSSVKTPFGTTTSSVTSSSSITSSMAVTSSSVACSYSVASAMGAAANDCIRKLCGVCTEEATCQGDCEVKGQPNQNGCQCDDICCAPKQNTDDTNDIADFIKKNEGVKPKAYDDGKGKITVGVGFNMQRSGAREDFNKALGLAQDDKKFDRVKSGVEELTLDEIDALFKQDLGKYSSETKNHLSGIELDCRPADVKAALVDIHFRGDLYGSPKMVGHINNGKWKEAATEYLNHTEYKKLKQTDPTNGVVKRMEANQKILKDYAASLENKECKP